mmetsp:Transcript_11676/g.40611  ORF Transcript_11676/g.40611 Transcript_11676/m.40611 type:complete len:85 (+) Transcript_11676:1316-1570(+)
MLRSLLQDMGKLRLAVAYTVSAAVPATAIVVHAVARVLLWELSSSFGGGGLSASGVVWRPLHDVSEELGFQHCLSPSGTTSHSK